MEYLDGAGLKEMIMAGAACLERQKSGVDALNVFPVPDGDTGTNMSLTMQAAVREMQRSNGQTVREVAEALATGSLMGARGNSGVILSQIFRGIARRLAGRTDATTVDLAEALQEGANTAYRAVMRPVEGTILTVAKEAARRATEIASVTPDPADFIAAVLTAAQAALARTPDLLPVLRQAGVVDAGGKGFVLILEGARRYLQGEEMLSGENAPAGEQTAVPVIPPAELVYPYCTELLLRGESAVGAEAAVRRCLQEMGDSLLVAGAGDILKVHVHTDDPGAVLSYCRQWGEMRDIKIDNMRYQHRSMHGETAVTGTAGPVAKRRRGVGVVAVSVGEGLTELFASLGVHTVVQGGQTMNPSTEELAKAARELATEQVIILPNNGNIIMAAGQVKELTEQEIHVVPTRSIPEGIAAMVAFDAGAKGEEAAAAMARAAQVVKTGEVTYAVRDSQYSGGTVREGDIIGLRNREIKAVGTVPEAVAAALFAQMVDAESSLLTLYTGADVAEDALAELVIRLETAYPQCSIETYRGGQPLYYYFLSVE
ncbi:MAG: DAK2 domain-containing protein [bacterium]|jgi:DAK2 domain fusion protein YloV